jgi:predicted phage tail protein
MAKLTTVQNIYDRKQDKTINIDGGLAVFHYLSDIDEECEIVVSLNGRIIENYSYMLKQDDHIAVSVLPKGGGGGGGTGKQVLSVVAMVALTVVTAGAGAGVAAALGASGLAATAITIGVNATIMVGGMLIMNALMPTPSIDSGLGSSKGNSLESSSPTYSFGSKMNVAQEGTALPLLLGRRRVYPPIKGYYVASNGDTQNINILYSISEGQIDSITDIYIDGQPLENYTAVTYQTRLGEVNQSVISNFRDSTVTVNQSRTLNDNITVVEYQTAGNINNSIGITMMIPNGLYSINQKKGTYNDYSISFRIEYKKTSDTSYTAEDHTISGVYKTLNRFTYNIPLSGDSRYDIRITRTSGFNTSSTVANGLVLDYINEIVNTDFIYPCEALLCISALATDQLNGSFPTVSCMASNIYAGGVWGDRPLDNPAWACLFLLKYFNVKDLNIDFEAFEEWANYCDEKGYYCSLYMDSQNSLPSYLNMISVMGRASIVQFGSTFTPMINKPLDVTTQKFLITRANIENGEATISYVPYADRANAIEVTYYDEDNLYEATNLQVWSNFYSASSIEKKANITLYGCTNKNLAARLAKLYLNQNQYITEYMELTAFNDMIACKPGDIVDVGIKYMTNALADGRLVSKSGNIIQFDSFFELEQYEDYEVTLRLENDSVVTFEYNHQSETVVTDTIDFRTITIPTITTPINVVYAIGKLEVQSTNQFRVLNITRANDFKRKIKMIEYNPNVYDDDTDIVLEPVILLDDIANLKVNEILETDSNGVAFNRVVLSWVSFTNSIKKVYVNNTYIGETSGNKFVITNDLLDNETYQFKVNSETLDYKYIGRFTPYPPNNLSFSSVNGSTKITWDSEFNQNFSYYEISIGETVYSTQTNQLTVSLNTGTYLVRIRTFLLNGASSQYATLIMNITVPSISELIQNNYLLEQAFKDGTVTIFVGESANLSSATPFDLWRVTPTSLTLGELTWASDQLKLLTWKDFESESTVFYKYYDGVNWVICNAEQRLIIEKSLMYVSTQALSDGAYRIFNTTPFIPYDDGDLWIFGDKIRVSTTQRLSGSFNIADWLDSEDDRLNISPTVDNTQVVKDGNGVVEVVQTGLNSTPTKFGFWDGVKWRSYIASNGDFNLENAEGTSYIKYDSEDESLQIKAKIVAEAGSNTLITGSAANDINNNTTTINGGKISTNSLSAISANLGTITAGNLQNTDNTNFMNLNATGIQPFIKVKDNIQLNADGSGFFSRVLVTAPNVIASGQSASLPYIDSFTHYVDTGINIPANWATASTTQYMGTATISGGLSYNGGGNGYMEVSVVIGDGLRTTSPNIPIDNRIYLKCVFTKVQGGQINITSIDWKLVQI